MTNSKKVTFSDKKQIYHIEPFDDLIERISPYKLQEDVFIKNIQIIIKRKSLLRFLKKIKNINSIINLMISVTYCYFNELFLKKVKIQTKKETDKYVIDIPINETWDKKYSRINIDVNYLTKKKKKEIEFEYCEFDFLNDQQKFIYSKLSVKDEEHENILYCHEFFDAQEIVFSDDNKYQVKDFFTNSDFILFIDQH